MIHLDQVPELGGNRAGQPIASFERQTRERPHAAELRGDRPAQRAPPLKAQAPQRSEGSLSAANGVRKHKTPLIAML